MVKLSHRRKSLSELGGLLLVAYDLWRRLPRPLRRRLVRLARTYGPRIARRALAARRAR